MVYGNKVRRRENGKRFVCVSVYVFESVCVWIEVIYTQKSDVKQARES